MDNKCDCCDEQSPYALAVCDWCEKKCCGHCTFNGVTHGFLEAGLCIKCWCVGMINANVYTTDALRSDCPACNIRFTLFREISINTRIIQNVD